MYICSLLSLGRGVSHHHAEYKSTVGTLLSLQGEKIQKFIVCILCFDYLTICAMVSYPKECVYVCLSCPPQLLPLPAMYWITWQEEMDRSLTLSLKNK